LLANREKTKICNNWTYINGELITNNLSKLKVHLNSESYPYDNLNVDFSKNQYAHLYETYTRFQSSYYNRESQPCLTPNEFKLKASCIVVDLSYKNESVTTGPIDVRISKELKTPSHENTQAYCLLIHDRLVEYNPLNGLVQRVI